VAYREIQQKDYLGGHEAVLFDMEAHNVPGEKAKSKPGGAFQY
jgi:hypothetical protein